jgi:N-acetylneuraminic acid mutarotase
MAVSWTGLDGALYLFGGHGYDSAGGFGELNDLWKYDPATNQWTWLKGSNIMKQFGTYGSQGVPNPSNTPGARYEAVSWTGTDGSLYLFGGFYFFDMANWGYLNDLWKYDIATNQWMWIKGSNGINQAGDYGTQGVPAPANTPGARQYSVPWKGSDGTFYLFGGEGFDSTGNAGLLNDLWRFNPATNQWTWLKGPNMRNQPGTYGTQGVSDPANMPGGGNEAASWTGTDGALYLFGGRQYFIGPSGLRNDLWKYDPVTNQWTWIKGANTVNQSGTYGTQGVPNPANTPGARYESVSWRGTDGTFYLFSGSGYDSGGIQGTLADLWNYDPASNQWTWVKGAKAIGQIGTYGTQGTPDAANTPGGRQSAVSWTGSDGALYLFGGSGRDGVGASGYLNDLWKYSPTINQWTWLKGANTINQYGTYGTLGTPAPANTPGGRQSAVSWTGSDGALYLFGGYGYSASSAGYLNDLWKYDPASNQWTWLKGANTPNQSGIYGTQGTPAPGNSPGGRYIAVSWTGSDGALYLFGGYGYDSAGASGRLNDLWKYDPAANQWTWLKGANTISQSGTYGTLGTPAPANTPGGRQSAVSWTGSDSALYLSGGYGYDGAGAPGYLNDLWRYNPATNQWTWLKGANAINQSGIYGTQGTPDAANTPGGRISAVSWTGSDGALYLFGGNGRDGAGASGRLNDLWKYDPTADQWTWLKGANTINQPGIYGAQGTPAPANTPGGRYGAGSWLGSDGAFYLFGGYGYDCGNYSTTLGDVWRAAMQYTVVFQTDATPGASLTGATTQSITRGSDCTSVTANAPAGYYFVNWTKDGADYATSNPLTVRNVNEDTTLTAVFALSTPDAPSSPGATSVQKDQLTWTWTDNSDFETGFKVWSGAGATGPNSVTSMTAANTESFTTTGLAANTQYAFQVAATNNGADSAKTPNYTTWTLIEVVSGLSFSGVSANSINVAAANTPSNLTTGSSGLFFINTTAGANSDWQQSSSPWASSGLTPNTQYIFSGKSRNGSAIETAATTAAKWTLAGAPSIGNNVTCDRATATWYPAGTAFTFSNPAGFGAGTHGGSAYRVSAFRYVWDTNATYLFGGSEPQWNAGSLAQSPVATGSYYLHLQSLNGEGVAAATTMDYGPFQIDTVTPTVSSIVRLDTNPTSAALVRFVVTFSESVTGVTTSSFGLSLTGVTGASISGVSGSGTNWSVTVNTGSGDGTIRCDMVNSAGVADVAGNAVSNVPFTGGQSYTIDKTAPTLLMSSAASNPTNTSPILVVVTFSEPVTGFGISDIPPSNATAGGFAGSGAIYSFNLTPSGQGLVTANIAAGGCTDAAGNGNAAAAQFSRTYDSIAPTVSMSSAAPNPTNASPIAVTVTFSEAVTGFESSDVSLSNATPSGFAGSGTGYSFNLAPSGQGAVTADIADGVCADAAGNANAAATQFSRAYDSVAPTAVMSSAVPNPTNASPISVTVAFSEPVAVFTISDIIASSATVSNFTGSGAEYSFDLIPTNQGTVRAEIAAGACADAAGNGNAAVAALDRMYDSVEPTGSISINDGAAFTSETAVTLSLSASDAGAGIALMRLSADGAAWSAWEAYGASRDWTLSGGDGAKGVHAQFRDAIGNVSRATSDTITLDQTGPVGSVTINSGAAYTSDFACTLTLSAVDTAGVAQLRMSNDALTWSAWTAYAATRPWTLEAGEGLKTVRVEFRDTLGNLSPAVTDTITVDQTNPAGSITVNVGAAFTSTAAVTLTLSATGGSAGISDMRLSNDGSIWSAWESYASARDWTLASGEGLKTVSVQFRNALGRTSAGTISDTITLDQTGPVGSLTINGGAAYTSETSIALAFAATDTGTGVARMRLSDTGSSWSAWQVYATATSRALPSGDGEKTIFAQFADALGNLSAVAADTILLDQTRPVSQMAAMAPTTTTVVVTLRWTASDPGATGAGLHCVTIFWSKDGGAARLLEGGPFEPDARSARFNAALRGGSGTYRFYSLAHDRAGNFEIATGFDLTLEISLPDTSVRRWAVYE